MVMTVTSVTDLICIDSFYIQHYNPGDLSNYSLSQDRCNQCCSERRVSTALLRDWTVSYDPDSAGLVSVSGTQLSREAEQQWRWDWSWLALSSSCLQISQPFSMVVSSRCLGYYSLAPGETLQQGRGRCPHCSSEVRGLVQVIPWCRMLSDGERRANCHHSHLTGHWHEVVEVGRVQCSLWL